MMLKKPGEKRDGSSSGPTGCSSSWSAWTILTPFSSALTPIASPGPPGRIASGRLPACVAFPSTVTAARERRRDRRDRERSRRVRRLGDDRAVGAEARLDAGARAEVVLRRLLADDRVQLEVALQLDGGVAQRLGGEPHRDRRALHVGRAEPVEQAVANLGVPGAAAEPAVRLDRRHGVDVAVQEQRAAPAPALADADERFRSGSSATQCVSRPACS